ncbi:MAG: hypothetical protein ACREP9_11555, partial [Candidatus Dormibacteraceae bacterium]
MSAPNAPPVGIAVVGLDPSGQVTWVQVASHSGGSGGSPNPIIQAISQNTNHEYFIGGQMVDYAILQGHRIQTPWPMGVQAFLAKLAIPKSGATPVITAGPQPFSPIAMYVDAGDSGQFWWTNIGPWALPDTNGVTVFEGMPIQLQVVASSFTPPGYQWLFNGSPIAGATSDTLGFGAASNQISGKYSVLVLNQNGATESAATPVTVLPLTKLGEALNAPTFQWRMGGSRSWEMDTNVTHDGVLSARTPFLDGGQDCWVESTVQGPGVLTFIWKTSTFDLGSYNGVDAYAPSDTFRFTVDGVSTLAASGEIDWTPHSVPIGGGTHTIRWAWSFEDKFAIMAGQNVCWLDEVSFGNGAPRITDSALQPDGSFK